MRAREPPATTFPSGWKWTPRPRRRRGWPWGRPVPRLGPRRDPHDGNRTPGLERSRHGRHSRQLQPRRRAADAGARARGARPGARHGLPLHPRAAHRLPRRRARLRLRPRQDRLPLSGKEIAVAINSEYQGQGAMDHGKRMVEEARAFKAAIGSTADTFTRSIDLRGRVDRNPIGMVLAAAGIGYFLGGGLFSPLTGKLVK